MIDVVSVKFKGRGKTYFFDPANLDVPAGVQVVVETSKGLELCECVQGNHTVTDERIVPPLRRVVRIATPDDLRIAELCKKREKEAFGIAEKKIAEHGLDMKLVDVECNFEGNKMLFFFTSDGRVDFRELVKDLAGEFRTRIELRQIGVRDEAKMLGGIGMCGRPYCCSQFLEDFEPVSTKMAKTQSLSLNPTKISGCCGRLMCCLRYEEEAYEELVKTVPKNGAFVETTAGYGNVVQVNLLRQKVKVKLDGVDEAPRTFEAEEVATVPGGRPKPGETPLHVLRVCPKRRTEEEPEQDSWVAPPMFAEDTMNAESPAAPAEKKSSSSRRHHRGGRGRGGKKPAQGEAAAQSAAKSAPQEGKKPQSGKKPPQDGAKKQQEKKPADGGRKSQSGGKPQGSQKPKTEGAMSRPERKMQGGTPAAAADAVKKSSGSRRRHRGGRGRGGNGGANSAPKAE